MNASFLVAKFSMKTTLGLFRSKSDMVCDSSDVSACACCVAMRGKAGGATASTAAAIALASALAIFFAGEEGEDEGVSWDVVWCVVVAWDSFLLLLIALCARLRVAL